jgi:Bacterial Ig-like domain (group 3)/Galactose oxidase, central domain/Bacterial Ig-like domain (group 2)
VENKLMRLTRYIVFVCVAWMAMSGIAYAKTNSSVALSSSSNPATFGAIVTLTATVTPSAATGTVTFKDGTTTLGTGTISSGKATFATSSLSVASHSITAAYGGNTTYNSSTSSALTEVVNKANSTTSVVSSLNPSSFGGSVKFTATVTPSAATGTVTFKDGTTTLGTGTISAGKATFTTTTLSVGSHAITAAYGGSTNYNASTSSTLTQVVNKLNSTATLFSSANPSALGSTVTFTATISPTAATGTVTFKDGTTTLGTGTISGGMAVFNTSTLAIGSHSITAAYGGDSNDNSSTSSTLTQTVKQPSSVTISASTNPSTMGTPVTFTATMSPTAATGTVTFKDASLSIGTGTLSGGKATFTTSTLAAGSHSITAVYGGNTTYISSTSAILSENVLAITSLAVSPANVSLPLNSKQQYTALATLSNGTNQDVTASVSWTSSSPTNATLDATGILTALAQGQSNVEASLGGTVGVTSLTVVGPTFWPVGNLNFPRWGHTATLLPNGKVLIVGGQDVNNNILASAELYDPSTGTFTTTANSLAAPRRDHTATLLPNGTVLIAGGLQYTANGGISLHSAEIYDPSAGTFTFGGVMRQDHYSHTATLLNTGMVLIEGGNHLLTAGGGGLSGNELYDPATKTFAFTGNLNSPRSFPSTTLLGDGTLLAIGGNGTSGYSLPSSEIFNPGTGTYSVGGSLTTARWGHSATLLASGKVLVVAGEESCPTTCPPVLGSSEIYDPAAKTFVNGPNVTSPRFFQTATRLNNGSVLIVGGGGASGSAIATAELFDATSMSFLGAGAMASARGGFTATLLNDGTVLIVGGQGTTYPIVGRAEIYSPTRPAPHSLQVTPSTVNLQIGDSSTFTAVDNLGNQRQDVVWTLNNSTVATLTSSPAPTLTAINTGVVTLTATVGSVVGQAQINVSSGSGGPPSSGTTKWSVPPAAGFSPLQLVQAVPSGAGPAMYSTQISSDGTQSLVQAVSADGQILWETNLPVINGNSVPDGFGGLLVTENNTCLPNQSVPMSIVDLDAATGQPTWRLAAAGIQQGSIVQYCYPDTLKWLEPQIAIRQDGGRVVAAITNNGLPPLTVNGSSIPIPSSTDTDSSGTQFSEFSPMGPPIVDADNSVYVEYEVRQIAYPPKIIAATLYLLKIAPDNTRTTITLSSTTQDINFLPGRILPDGSGNGVLATWTIAPSVPPQPAQPTHSYQAAHVVSGAITTTYNLPFTPTSVTFGQYPSFVLAENGVVYATDGSDTASGAQVVSMALDTGR